MREGRGAALLLGLGVLAALAAAGVAAAEALDGGGVLAPAERLAERAPAPAEDVVAPPEPEVHSVPLPQPEAPDVAEPGEPLLPEAAEPTLGPVLGAALAEVREATGTSAPALAPGAATAPTSEEPPAPPKAHAPHTAATPAPTAPSAIAGPAAIAGAAALVAGAVAYAWPMLKYALAPLYSRIAKDAVLVHDTRERIYRLVKEHPGIHAHEVASRLELAWGTAVHHLKLLEANHLLVSHRDGRYKRFFIAGEPTLPYRDAVALLRNATSKRIASVVAERPGLIQKQVCEALGVSSSLATWHLQRLAEAGVVLAERRGRVVHYEPGPAWAALKDLGATG